MTRQEQREQSAQIERALGFWADAAYWGYVWFSALVKGYDDAAVTA
jgi:hypothetical protein